MIWELLFLINLRFSTQKSADPLSLLSNISGNLNTAITRWRSLCTISHDRRVGWSVMSDFYSQFRFAYFGWFSLSLHFKCNTDSWKEIKASYLRFRTSCRQCLKTLPLSCWVSRDFQCLVFSLIFLFDCKDQVSQNCVFQHGNFVAAFFMFGCNDRVEFRIITEGG